MLVLGTQGLRRAEERSFNGHIGLLAGRQGWPKLNVRIDWAREYNHSIPAVLKNAIDNASRPYGYSAWARKPAGVLGGAIGTALALQHLRNILAYLVVPTLGQPEHFSRRRMVCSRCDGSVGASSCQFLQGWMDRYVAWVKRHSG